MVPLLLSPYQRCGIINQVIINRVIAHCDSLSIYIRHPGQSLRIRNRKNLNVMSAYGAISVPNGPVDLLPPTTWDLPQPSPGKRAAPFRSLVLHHLRLESARALPAGPSLLEYTYRIFAAEVEAGRTYPQEAEAVGSSLSSGRESDDSNLSGGDTHTRATQAVYTRAAFEAYFWAADVMVAIGQTDDDDDDGQAQVPNVGNGSASDGNLLEISSGVGGRSWEDALVGFYYVKPNYPGRSSHVSVSHSSP